MGDNNQNTEPTIEGLQAQILDLQDKIKEKDLKITELTDANSSKDKRITDLQEHNQKLFLRLQVDDNDQTDKKKEELQATPEEVANKYRGVIK